MPFYLLIFLLLLSIPTSQAQQTPRKTFSVYLIGDAGAATLNDPNITLLSDMAKADGENSAVIYLGDNIYPYGLRDTNVPERKQDEDILINQLSFAKEYKGRVFMIPGNHDWEKGKKNGWQQILRQGAFVDSLAGHNVFFPKNGCAGPVEVQLNEEIALILIDTQWLVHPWERPEGEPCDEKNEDDVIAQVKDMVAKNAHKKIIIAAHHPLYTYGAHGGKFDWKDHLFPLTLINKKLYIPLPIIGSIHPVARMLGISPQDRSNVHYKYFRKRFEEIFKQYPNLIYSAGHEHSLQYIYKDSLHYIVSGSGSKKTHVKQGKYSEFAAKEVGFSIVDFYDNGEVWTTYYAGNGENRGKELFKKKLMTQPYKPPVFEKTEYIDYSDSTIKAIATDRYKKTKRNYALFGENYRKVWEAEIEVPLLDLGTEKGGLKIVKRGAGRHTKSLRLEAKDGKQYVLRSLDKDLSFSVPDFMKDTFAHDAIQDQVSSANPYGPIIISPLAKSAGLYHTNPKIVYLPNDKRLGIFRHEFADKMYLFEERPDDDWREADYFGNSKKIYSTRKLIEKLEKDNDNEIDSRFLLKNRLFDMLIGDWDRHDDQWRWASYKKKGDGKYFKAIPRDRDQALFVNEGFFPNIVSRKWAVPRVEGFDESIRWTGGFNHNARFFDRYFLTDLSKQDWLDMADSLKSDLTDQKIDSALLHWEDTIQTLIFEETSKTLKARRDKMPKYAEDYYKTLAKKVNVLGSHKRELFEVERAKDGATEVTVRKIKKSGKIGKKLYHRTFYQKETKEIRLYGLKGDDQFKLTGKSKKGIKVRIISGEGEDSITDESRTGRLFSKGTLIYDTKDTQIQKGKNTRLLLDNDTSVHIYNRKEYKYNTLLPMIFLAYNVDDKVILGGGALIVTHGFRKEPYATKQTIIGAISPVTSGNRFRYKGDFTKVIGDWGIYAEMDAYLPTYVSNFAGLGNETTYDSNDPSFISLNHERVFARATLTKWLGQRHRTKFGIGVAYNHAEIDPTDDNLEGAIAEFAADNDFGVTPEQVYDNYKYAGLHAFIKADARNSRILPMRGAYFKMNATAYQPLSDRYDNYFNINAQGSLYYTMQLPTPFTMAFRTGWESNFGDYGFTMASKLGGLFNMRGYRKDRFWGRHSVFTNLEGRIRIIKMQANWMKGSLGVLGFWDSGRVWQDGEPKSSKWHHGYGTGLFFVPFDLAALVASFGFSEEDKGLFILRAGFAF